MSLQSQLSEKVGRSFSDIGLDSAFGLVVTSQRPEHSQFQCNGALAAAKQVDLPPHEIAQQVADSLTENPIFAKVEVGGPGFINLTLSDHFLAEFIDELGNDDRYGIPKTSDPKRILVDYGGPNVAKAMHVGHLRATIIGDCLANIMQFLGHDVTRDPHLGDWGLQMGMLIVGIQGDPNVPFPDFDTEGSKPAPTNITLEYLQDLYPRISAQCEQDPELAERAREATVKLQQGYKPYIQLWEKLVSVSQRSQEQDFADLGVHFDVWYGEATVNDRIAPMIDRIRAGGHAQESEGALIVPVERPDDTRTIPPLMLTKSDGGYLYGTTDMATIEMRVEELGIEQMLYVVDSRQSDHFVQLFRAARLTGICPPEVETEHVPFGTMNGKDGKPFRTREGGVVRLRDLIELVSSAARDKLDAAELAQEYPENERQQIIRSVGVAALKFGDLINGRRSDYIFDLDRFSNFEGKTGPYLQYGTVRIKSILRKAATQGLEPGPIQPATVAEERELMLWLTRIPEIMTKTVEGRTPNGVAEYAFDLVGVFNRFYGRCHILSEPDPSRQSSWIKLVTITLGLLTLLLSLLGIDIPERM